MNKHRSIIYSRRDKILDNQNMHEDIKEMVQNQISALVQSEFTKQSQKDNFDVKEIIKKVNEFSKLARERELTEEEKKEREKYRKMYIEKFKESVRGHLDSIKVVRVDDDGNPIDDDGNVIEPEA